MPYKINYPTMKYTSYVTTLAEVSNEPLVELSLSRLNEIFVDNKQKSYTILNIDDKGDIISEIIIELEKVK